MDPLLIGAIGVLALLILLSAGLHIAFAMAAVGIVGLILTTDFQIAFASLEIIPFSTVSVYSLSVVPLFILMGNLAFIAGVTKDLFDVGFKWFGRLPGGLAMATIFTSAGFSAATGSSVAMVASMSKIALPEMDRYGYSRDLSLGSIAGAGTLGILIPPSIIAVIYAIITDQSVGEMLVAGFVPGVLTAVFFMFMVGIRATIKPSLGPRAQGISWMDSIRSLKGVWGILVIFGGVIGTIYLGIATPTEAASVGCLGAFILALLSRNLNWVVLKGALLDTVKITVMILTITIGASIFTLFLARAGFAASFIDLFLGLDVPTTVLVMLFLLMYIPLGMFFEPFSMLLLTLPITFPILQSLGVDGVWYGIMVIIMVEIGLLTPPVGLNVFVLRGSVPDSTTGQIFKSIIWFFVVDIIIIILLFLFPKIVTFLPDLMGK